MEGMTDYVTYRYAQNGIIAYDYDKVTNWEKVGETVASITIVLGSAAIVFFTGGMVAPVPAG